MSGWQFNILGKTLFEFRSSTDIENPSVSLNSPEAIDILFDGEPNKINHTTALTYSAIWRAVTLLSGIIAYLPKQVYREDEEGNKIPDKKHPVYRLIHSEPNQRDTSFKFFENLMQHDLLHGNHLSVINRDRYYRTTSLRQISPTDFDVIESGESLFYKVKGYSKLLPATDVIHVKGFGDGLKGKDPITVARESMQLGLTYTKTANTLFKNGHLNDIYLQVPGSISDPQFEKIKASWKAYKGSENAGKTPVLPGGTEIKSFTTSPENMQFLESRKFHVSEIARWFGTPPHKLFDLERSTNNNIEQQAIELVTDTIMLWTERIEQEFNKKLFREDEKDIYSVEFNLNGLLRGDLKTRAEYYNKATGGRPWMTPDEIRRLENQKVLGGDAGKLITPLNFKPADAPAKTE